MLTYEERLSKDSKWALSKGSRHFESESAVQRSLKRIARRLAELEIPYAVAGIAKKYDMHDEADFMDKDEPDDLPSA